MLWRATGLWIVQQFTDHGTRTVLVCLFVLGGLALQDFFRWRRSRTVEPGTYATDPARSRREREHFQ